MHHQLSLQTLSACFRDSHCPATSELKIQQNNNSELQRQIDELRAQQNSVPAIQRQLEELRAKLYKTIYAYNDGFGKIKFEATRWGRELWR
jgi:hypothetical protein